MRADKNKEDLTVVKKNPVDSALKYLASRDRTCQEMKKYLSEKGFSAEEIQHAINYLLDMNYLNDEVYAEKYIQYAILKGKGIIKIKNELRQKGIEQELIDDIVSSSEDLASHNERKRAFVQALKMMENWSISDLSDGEDGFEMRVQRQKELQRIKMKLARKLEYLGYSSGVIVDTIDKVLYNQCHN